MSFDEILDLTADVFLILWYTTVVFYCCCSTRCPYNVPGGRYYTHHDTSTYKRSMFCHHTCFASHTTWLAGPAVGLCRACSGSMHRVNSHNKREGCTYCLLLWADGKKGCTPLNIDEKGDVAFCGRLGVQNTCRRHQSNGPARCVRFHGTLFFTYTFTTTVSEQPNAQWSVVQALSSPKSQTSCRYVRVTYHLRTPSVRFIQEELHNSMSYYYHACL